jgi:hypothetical protein
MEEYVAHPPKVLMLTGQSLAHVCGPASQASYFSKLKYAANPVELEDLKPLFLNNKHEKLSL